MGRRVGAKRAGRAPARRKKGSSLLRPRARRQPELLGREGGGGGGGGGGDGGCAFPIWRRWLTSPEDVAQPARGGAGPEGAGSPGRGPGGGGEGGDPLTVTPSRALGYPRALALDLASLGRRARGPPPVAHDVSSLRPPPPWPLEKEGLQPETGEAPHEWGSRGLARVDPAQPQAMPLPPPTPPCSELAAGGGKGRAGRQGPGLESGVP